MVKRELTPEQKKVRAEKTRATKAANKAIRARKREERKNMIQSMRDLILNGDVDDQTRAKLIIEIGRMEVKRYR